MESIDEAMEYVSWAVKRCKGPGTRRTPGGKGRLEVFRGPGRPGDRRPRGIHRGVPPVWTTRTTRAAGAAGREQ